MNRYLKTKVKILTSTKLRTNLLKGIFKYGVHMALRPLSWPLSLRILYLSR